MKYVLSKVISLCKASQKCNLYANIILLNKHL